jgi:hypothetical protein
MFKRRELLTGGITVIFGGVPQTCFCAQGFGCSITRDAAQSYLGADGAFDPRSDKVIARSGNRDFDFATAQTLSKLSDAFNVLPGFAYFNKGPSRNAFASKYFSIGKRHPDGVV